jgi:hypothetical protein
MYTAKAGDVNENPITGERGVVRWGRTSPGTGAACTTYTSVRAAL